METLKTRAKRSPNSPRTDTDGALYAKVREHIPHGLLSEIARKYNLPPWKLRRVMKGYFNPLDTIQSAARRDVLTVTSKCGAIKTGESGLIANITFSPTIKP